MSLQKYLFIVLSIFMQYMPLDARNEMYETDKCDQIEEYNDDEDNNDTIKYLLVAAGVLTVGGLIYWCQSSLIDMTMPLFGDRVNEHGQVVINSQKAIAIMNQHQSLQNVRYKLRGPVAIEGGKIKSGSTLVNGSYFTANGVKYVVEN